MATFALALPVATRVLANYWERRGLTRNDLVFSVLGFQWPYLRGLFRFHLTLFSLMTGVFLAAYFVYPELSPALAAIRPRWRSSFTAATLALTSAWFAAFILRYGNRQFGGFDCSLLIDVGWRLVRGQIPYRDFICTLPPGFFLVAKYAFQMLGVRWDALLWADAIFSAATFLWIYFLLAAILQSRSLAYLGAVAIQCAGVLSVSYWWYNCITMIAATIFFLSCVLYLKRTSDHWPQISYVAALALLGLMKPNVAFLAGAGGVFFSLLATSKKTRLLLLTLAAFGADLAFLAANHVSVTGLIAGYLAAAAGRGFTVAGIGIEEGPEIFRLVICTALLMTPLLFWWRQLLQDFKKSNRRGLALSLLLIYGPAVSFIAALTDMELKDVEWPLVFCFGLVVLASSWPNNRASLAKCYFCFLLAVAASDLYLGAARFRVRKVGDFFALSGESEPPGDPFFEDMRASHVFRVAVEEIHDVVAYSPEPIFFGSRLEFAYAAFGIPSPLRLPVWWHPGSSFRETDEPAILQAWQDQCFQTLIFLKGNYPYYSREFRQVIVTQYDPEDFWVGITVFHRRPGAACASR